MIKPLLPMLALAAFALAPLASHAAPVTYVFTGQVESDDAGRGLVSFSGNFRFDSSTPDAIADASTGAYAHSGAPWGMTLSFDGDAPFTVSTAFNVLVSNDLPGGDQWGLLAQDALQSLSLSLFDFGGTVFSSDALPLPVGGLTLAAFGWSTLMWESAAGTLQGRLDTLACSEGCVAPPLAVPEPGTLALSASAGVLMALRRRRRP